MTIEEFKIEIKKLGLNITDEMLEENIKKLEIIYETLIETNKTINLTRIVTKEEVYLKHFYDSLTLSKIYDLTKVKTLCDIGTGAGFPGLVLKVFYPNLEISLIDSLQKRVNYLNNLIEKLNLTGIKAYHIRAEDLIKKQEKYDIVTARAVAALPKLLLWTMPLVKNNGRFLAMKGNVEEELIEAKNILEKNKWYINNKVEFQLPNKEDKRTILEIKNKA